MNIGVLHSELSPTLLTDYLSRLIEKDSAVDSRTAPSNSAVLGGATAGGFDAARDLKNRIPRHLWPVLIDQLQL